MIPVLPVMNYVASTTCAFTIYKSNTYKRILLICLSFLLLINNAAFSQTHPTSWTWNMEIPPQNAQPMVELFDDAWFPSPAYPPKPYPHEMQEMLLTLPAWLRHDLKERLWDLMAVYDDVDKRIAGLRILTSPSYQPDTLPPYGPSIQALSQYAMFDVYSQEGPQWQMLVHSTGNGEVWLTHYRRPNYDYAIQANSPWIKLAEQLGSYTKPYFYDWNQDSWMDIVLLSEEPRQAHVLIRDQGEALGFKRQSIPLPNLPDTIDCLNMNGTMNQKLGRKALELVWVADNTLYKASYQHDENTWSQPTSLNFLHHSLGEYDFSTLHTVQSMDFSNDGKEDLILSFVDGWVRFFKAPEFNEHTSLAIHAPPHPNPVFWDLDEDGDLDILMGNSSGKPLIYVNQPQNNEPFFMQLGDEHLASPYLEAIQQSYFKPTQPVSSYQETSLWQDILALLEQTPPELLDEVGFSIAHTPKEVIEAMHIRHECDIFLENAQSIYTLAAQLPYVSIKEYPTYTTLIIQTETGPYELSKEQYYWYVVHPRLQLEIPARVNPEFWEQTADDHNITEDAWINAASADPHPYMTEDRTFWRSKLPQFKVNNKTCLEHLLTQTHVEASIETIHQWIMGNEEQRACLKFGYASNDYQPLIIFTKGYGSCGEYSLLTCALARTFLIPCRIAVNTGEDHQWNEVLIQDRWVHWDTTKRFKQGWDKPLCYDSNQTFIGGVMYWRGDDQVQQSLLYTDTAHLQIDVTVGGESIDGAWVGVFTRMSSHPNLSVWSYTDLDGVVEMELGDHRNGYALLVLLPNGACQISNYLYIQENKTYHITIDFPVQEDLPLHRTIAASTSQEALLNLCHTILPWDAYQYHYQTLTPSKKEADELFRASIGYQGTTVRTDAALYDPTFSYLYPIPYHNPEVQTLQGMNTEWEPLHQHRMFVFNPFVRTSIKAHYPLPFIPLEQEWLAYPSQHTMNWGELLPFHLEVPTDASVFITWNDGTTSHQIPLVHQDQPLQYALLDPKEHMMAPGAYCIRFYYPSAGGQHYYSNEIQLKVKWDQAIHHQRLTKEDPIWWLGPFEVESGMHYLTIEKGIEPGSQEDILLEHSFYYDKNGNQMLEPDDESVKKTQASALTLLEPNPGLYWYQVKWVNRESVGSESNASFWIAPHFDVNSDWTIRAR